MPYTRPGPGRDALDRMARTLAEHIGSPGDLNRAICIVYCALAPDDYASKSAALGAITDAIAEIRRRDVERYEAGKAADNGDLPWPVLTPK